MLGLRQAALARAAGISASYLNLIEHNRRRIGGKLLLDIAAALGVEPSALTEGAEAALIAALRGAASETSLPEAELARADEFAGRFPGWAEVLAGVHRRTLSLEQTVEALNDRVANDPALAASLHEVLSTAAAIRATAEILADDPDITPDWQARFHGNLDQDSRRLSDSAKALVSYLEAEEEGPAVASPQEELDAFLLARNYALPELEEGDGDLDALVAKLTTRAAQQLALPFFAAWAADARALPLAQLRAAEARLGCEPIALAEHLGVPIALVLRRLALLHHTASGLVICDRAGALVFRKPLDGFALPRFGVPCPLWPLFEALSQPGQLLHAHIAQPGRDKAAFETFAIAEYLAPRAYNAPPLTRAVMLVLPVPQRAAPEAVRQVGATCRVCAAEGCPSRREPSILSGVF